MKKSILKRIRKSLPKSTKGILALTVISCLFVIAGAYAMTSSSQFSASILSSQNTEKLYGAASSSKTSLTVLSPNGGETLSRDKNGSFGNIQWKSENMKSSDLVNIDLVTNLSTGEIVRKNIASNIKNSGKFYWKPEYKIQSANHYQVKVSSRSRGISDVSNSFFSIKENHPSLTVLSPNGGETLSRSTNGSFGNIQWKSENMKSSDLVNIDLISSFSTGEIVRKNIASNIKNSGKFAWKSTPIGFGDYKVRVSSSSSPDSLYDVSDFTFLVNPTSLKISSPKGGETFSQTNSNGVITTIKWNTENLLPSDFVRIFLVHYVEGSASEIKKLGEVKNSGSFIWKTDKKNLLPENGFYSIYISTVSDYPNQEDHACDVSCATTGEFYLNSPAAKKPSLTVISPNGGETLSRSTNGSFGNIQWKSENMKSSELVNIDLIQKFSTGEVVRGNIATNVKNSGKFAWKSDYIESGNYAIKISSPSLGISDNSNNNFSIKGPVINIFSPKGGERFPQTNPNGIITTIKWEIKGSLPSDKVDIYLYSFDEKIQSSNVEKIASTKNSGSFVWKTNKQYSNDFIYSIRIIIPSNKLPEPSSSTGAFYFSSNKPSPAIEITSPIEKQLWKVGSKNTITWKNNPSISKVTISLIDEKSQDVIGSVKVDTKSTSGSYTMTVPSYISEKKPYKIKLSAYSINGSKIGETTSTQEIYFVKNIENKITVSVPASEKVLSTNLKEGEIISPISWDWYSSNFIGSADTFHFNIYLIDTKTGKNVYTIAKDIYAKVTEETQGKESFIWKKNGNLNIPDGKYTIDINLIESYTGKVILQNPPDSSFYIKNNTTIPEVTVTPKTLASKSLVAQTEKEVLWKGSVKAHKQDIIIKDASFLQSISPGASYNNVHNLKLRVASGTSYTVLDSGNTTNSSGVLSFNGFPNGGLVIKAEDEVTIELLGNISSSLVGTNPTTKFEMKSLSAKDSVSGDNINVIGVPTNGGTVFTLVSKGTLSVKLKAADTPDSQILLAGASSPYALGAYEFDAEYEDVRVNDLAVLITGDGTAPANDHKALNTVSLYYKSSGAAVLKSNGQPASTNTINSAGLAILSSLNLLINKDEKIILLVKGTLNDISSTGVAASGMAFSVSLQFNEKANADFDIMGESSGSDYTSVGTAGTDIITDIGTGGSEKTAEGKRMYAYNNKVIATRAAIQPLTLASGTDRDLLKFTLTPSGDGTTTLKSVIATINLFDAKVTDPNGAILAVSNVRLYSGSVLIGTATCSGGASGGTCSFLISTPDEISPNGETYTIRSEVYNVEIDDKITTSIAINADAPGSDGITWRDYGTNGLDGVDVRWIDLGASDSVTSKIETQISN